jgi:hypothetical protein
MFANKYETIFDIKFNWKTISLLGFLAVFPNLLGTFHATLFGVRLHVFQYLIFLAAIIYGPVGGMISGAFGSVYTAMALHNPYIIVGNIILGGLVGLFVKRYNFHVISAVLTAFIIQLPWLWMTDVYLAGMPMKVVNGIVVALLVSNLLWGTVANLTAKRIKSVLF